MRPMIRRRRFLAIAASAAVVSGHAGAATASWRGRAMGAEASITLGGAGRARAAETFAAVAAEVERLEDIFSLFRDTSAISRLNRDGELPAPPAELVEVLRLCAALHQASGGAFDPTIQPVWSVLAGKTCGRAGDYHAARQAVGWDGVEITDQRIGFVRFGMAITLNGVAQGYVTDRIAALMRARGFENVLVDMGEIAALGRNNGAPWTVDVVGPGGRIAGRLSLVGRCLAVSAPGGTALCGGGHILDPRNNPRPTPRGLAAVSADRAVLADGLSTACCLLTDRAARDMVARFDGAVLETLN